MAIPLSILTRWFRLIYRMVAPLRFSVTSRRCSFGSKTMAEATFPELRIYNDTRLIAEGIRILPDRLSDKPPDELRKQGFPKPVFSLRVRHDDELKAVLDWYEQKVGNLDILALEKLKAVFVATFPDFEKLGFEADHGTYWDTERHYKQNLIDRAAQVVDRISELQDLAFGDDS